MTDFYQVLDARNKLIAAQYGLGRNQSHIASRYEGFNAEVCSPCPSWTRRRCKDSSEIFGDRPTCSNNARISNTFETIPLVQRERWLADQDVADLLDDSRLQFRVNNFRTICGATILSGRRIIHFCVRTEYV